MKESTQPFDRGGRRPGSRRGPQGTADAAGTLPIYLVNRTGQRQATGTAKDRQGPQKKDRQQGPQGTAEEAPQGPQGTAEDRKGPQQTQPHSTTHEATGQGPQISIKSQIPRASSV